MDHIRESNEKGIEEVACKIGMEIPFHQPDPEGYFENNIKYYCTDSTISDNEIINKLSYFPFYGSRSELIQIFEKELPPELYYKDGHLFQHGEKRVDLSIFLGDHSRLLFKPDKNEVYKDRELKKIVEFLTFFDKHNAERIFIAKRLFDHR
jgi:hypothetical protein